MRSYAQFVLFMLLCFGGGFFAMAMLIYLLRMWPG